MFKKYSPLILIVLLIVMLAAAFLFKKNLNHFIAGKMQQGAETGVVLSGEAWVDSLFNYSKNGKEFQYSLLEFKSNGCAICRQMEPELEQLQSINKPKFNVVVLNVMNPNSQNVMKYFGISAVPTQILLNYRGNEIYRNYGFISAENLLQKTKQ